MKPHLLPAVLTLLMAGCVTSSVRTTKVRLLTPDRPEATDRLDPRDVSARVSRTTLGEFEYDDDALPLVSPNGEYLAVRVGSPPSWKIKCAQNGSSLPSPCRIEIRRISNGLQVEHTITGRYLLGRGLNAEGFLIEEPRADGSRRIGLVAWSDGRISWLLDDANINAFADIDDNGTLAFARRAFSEPGFELVVMKDGETWVLPSEWERSWIDPVISPDGRTLFVFRLGDGTLELAWTRLNDQNTFENSLQFTPISERINARMTQTILAGQTGTDSSPPGKEPRLLFRHPQLGRLVVWTPLDDLLRPFPADTITATMIDEHRAIAGNVDTVKLVELPTTVGQRPITVTLQDAFEIPRRLGNDPKVVLLFQPQNGRYKVSRLDIVDIR